MLPGPPERTVLGRQGNLLAFSRDPLGYIQAAQARFGPIGALARGDDALIYALGPTFNRHLLDQPPPRERLSDPAADRVLAALQTPQHSAPAPIDPDAFHRIVVQCVEEMLARWGMSQPIDVAYVMRRLTLRIALWSVWGIETDGETRSLGLLLNQWSSNLSAVTPSRLPLHLSAWSERRMRRLADQLQRDLLPLVGDPGKTRSDNDRALVADLLARFVAIHECSCSALTWAILLLSQHPRVLYDLQAELASVLRGGSPAPDQLQRLSLLRRVIAETLRLLPPISVGCWRTTAPIEFGSYRFRSGTSVIYSPFVTHRAVDKFVAPARFRPERWLYLDPAADEYVPFGLASPITVNAPLITTLVALVLAPLLQRFHLALAPGARIDRAHGFALMPRHGLPMIIAPPDRALTHRAAQGNIREMVALPGEGLGARG